jgi:SagB-type dehydrogenase family enzyme
MMFTELAEPAPRREPLIVPRMKASMTRREFLEVPANESQVDFWNVIAHRRSIRHFGVLDRLDLAKLLWHAIKTRETSKTSCGNSWQSRPYPSAGGIYPIDVLVVEQNSGNCHCAWYNALSHSLDMPETANPGCATQLYLRANEVLPVEQGTVLWFVANCDAANAMYSNPESLIWRDSGALLAAIYFVSEALGIACCALGATGCREIRARTFWASEDVSSVVSRDDSGVADFVESNAFGR